MSEMSIEEKRKQLQLVLDGIDKGDMLETYIKLKRLPFNLLDDEELYNMVYDVKELRFYLGVEFYREKCTLKYPEAYKKLAKLNGYEHQLEVEGNLPPRSIVDADGNKYTPDESYGIFASINSNWEPNKATMEKYKNNKTVMASLFIQRFPHAAEFMGEELKKDRLFILELLGIGNVDASRLNPIIQENFSDDKDILLEYAKKDERAIAWASPSLKKDKDFAFEIAKVGGSLSYFDKSIRQDRELMKRCVEVNGNVIGDLDKSLRDDTKYMREVLLLAGNFKSEIAATWGDEVVYTCLSDFIPEDLRKDEEFMRIFYETGRNLSRINGRITFQSVDFENLSGTVREGEILDAYRTLNEEMRRDTEKQGENQLGDDEDDF